MPSPFPGMDPYLEGSLWPDVHASLLPKLRAAIVRLLPDCYSALIGQYVWLEGSDDDDRLALGVPDVFVSQSEQRTNGHSARSQSASIAPVITTLPAVRRSGHRYLRITDRDRRRLVTVVELLSPSNKDSGKNRPHYLEKRNEYLATGVNLVEIDLLRAGERMPLGDPSPTPTDYLFAVIRADSFPKVELWPFSLRDELPALIVPLDPSDGDLPVDMKPCLDQIYAEARYENSVSYSAPANPPLRKADAAWAAELLKKHAKKSKK